MVDGNGSGKCGIESRFENGRYSGYEVRLEVRRLTAYQPVQLGNARAVHDFMRDLSNESSEYVYELLMDTKHRLTGVYMVGKGGIDRCLADLREIYKAALVTNSPCFAIVHNHPSGVAEPSLDDQNLVQRVKAGAEILGLEFLDSVIIGNGSYFSFKNCGLMP